MGGTLINDTLSSLSSGVSEQYAEARFDSQVAEMINCMPTLARGILRRNPIVSNALLADLPGDLRDAFIYSYDRGTTDEQYIMIVPGDGSGRTYNVHTGAIQGTTTGST